jgi:hypothetical protein
VKATESIADNTLSLHMCRFCGCIWRRWREGKGWSLADVHQRACKLCDNADGFERLLAPVVVADADPKSDMRWGQRVRVQAVLDRLAQVGNIRRADLQHLFSISSSQASVDLRAARKREKRMVYDVLAKWYVLRGAKPIPTPAAEEK